MVQTFLLFDTITNEKTVKFMQRDIITSTITWYLGLVGSNNFGPFTLSAQCWFATDAQEALSCKEWGNGQSIGYTISVSIVHNWLWSNTIGIAQ